MKHTILIILFYLLSLFAAFSQTNNNGAMTWEDFVTIMTDETDDENGPDSELFENLYELHYHPLNLNTITEQDLFQLPFLSTEDINNIMFYIDNHRPLMSTGELMFIYSLDRQKRLMTQLFCYAGDYKKQEYSLKKLFKYSKNEITVRNDIPFYTKTGYSHVDDSILAKNPNKVYQGNRLYHSLRYNFSSQDHFFAGFQMEKDPGEKYIDHFAGYAMIKNIGHISTAIVGNYRVSFGHGLVVNTGSSFGKAMKLSSMEIIDKGITKHSSTSESGYFTGGAATFKFGKIRASAFLSYQKADATYNSDSVGLSSLKTDGLHRTLLEQSKKNNITKSDFGTNIHFDFQNLQFSLTAATTHLNLPLQPKYSTKSTFYKQYNPQGCDFASFSLSYSYRLNKLMFSGETAISSSAVLATINQLQWTPNSLNTFTIIQRHYGVKYNSINARAFGENSSVKNEQGIYIGWNSSAINNINISAYIDAMYFPWLKYQVSGSSYGFEGQTQITYTPSDKHNFTLRYRIKSKQKDSTESNISTLRYKTNQSIKIQHNLQLCENIILKTSVIGSIINFENTNNKGIGISEAIRYTVMNKLRFDASLTYFNTDSYDSRIYNYESSLLYSFAMNTYYYQGLRGTLLASYNILEKLNLTAKLGSTIYFNKDVIGTNLEQINNKHKEDLQIQLRWKF